LKTSPSQCGGFVFSIFLNSFENYYTDMTKNNFIVISGGPGGGKTSLLESLSKNGYKYIRESGRVIIRERIRKGLSPRPSPEEFARQMFQMDYENFINHADILDILFFDRSFLDSAFLIHQSGGKFFNEIRDSLITNRFYTKVFMTPPWKEIYTVDSERDQTFDESVEIYEILSHWYLTNGYELVTVPRLPVEMRVKMILDEIK
jgi:predicted ATPase